ncbi:hypothetical protein GOBAR_DD10740 [Gossypium barbadense]|nr:hypothetical protein GOBAR_DD10740 [Gossypium barbadense]
MANLNLPPVLKIVFIIIHCATLTFFFLLYFQTEPLLSLTLSIFGRTANPFVPMNHSSFDISEAQVIDNYSSWFNSKNGFTGTGEESASLFHMPHLYPVPDLPRDTAYQVQHGKLSEYDSCFRGYWGDDFFSYDDSDSQYNGDETSSTYGHHMDDVGLFEGIFGSFPCLRQYAGINQ